MHQNKTQVKWGLNTPTYKALSPLHREVVADVFSVYEREEGENLVTNLETSIDKVAKFHNVNTSVVYDYFDKEIESLGGQE